MKKKTLVIDGKTTIKCGKVEITDKGKPFSTRLLVDGKELNEVYTITKMTYEVNVNGKNAGKHRLAIEYYPKVD